MKKTLPLLLAISLLLASFSFASANGDHYGAYFDEIEAAVSKAENTVMSKYSEDLTRALNNRDMATHERILNQAIEERRKAADKVYERYGIVTLASEDEPEIQPRSLSSDMVWQNESIRYDSASNAIFYTVEWKWLTNGDTNWDIEDIAGVSISNPNAYYIDKSFAKTWANSGGQTGYVDDSGNHTPTGSYITKRSETATGVMFNVNDYKHAPNQLFFTRTGRMTLVVRKKSNVSGTPYVKFIASYEHNFKNFSWDVGAKISSDGWNPATGVISITYSHVNARWLRASGGKSYGS